METTQSDIFWNLIDKAVEVSNGDNSIKEQYLITELAKLSFEDILEFEISLRKAIIEADDYKIMGAAKIIEGYLSDDSYLYFRCWLIGLGKKAYFEALKNPDSLASYIQSNEFAEFEPLICVSDNAYSLKTGKEEDESFPRNTAYNQGFDYDFGAPPTKGTDWTEEDLPKLFPTLWAKMN